jgi:hypothetical protein
MNPFPVSRQGAGFFDRGRTQRGQDLDHVLVYTDVNNIRMGFMG